MEDKYTQFIKVLIHRYYISSKNKILYENKISSFFTPSRYLYKWGFIVYNITMISWLKKHFIPHQGNDHRPHVLRNSNIKNILILVVFLEIFAFLIPTFTYINRTGGMAAVISAVLANLTNEERQAQNLQTLAVSPILNKAAEMKAADMATKSYFAHTSPEGKTPWYWLDQAGYKYQYAGENLAINFSDSKDVTNAWMASPTHRANIIKGNYSEIGTGIAIGMYEGRKTIFVAQVYANPFPEIPSPTEFPQPDIKKIPTYDVSGIVDVSEGKISDVKEETTKVLGTELGTEIVTNTETVDNATNPIEPVQKPTFWQKVFASPRNTTNVILYIVFGIITIALLLYVFIKVENYHPDLITNGLLVLAIVGIIFVANYYFSHRDMVIAQSFDYSNEGELY